MQLSKLLLAGLLPFGALVAAEFPPELVDYVSYAGNPVFSPTRADTWDRVFRERGFILKEGDTWHMWYAGGNRTRVRYLGYATSADGLQWTRHPDNPVFDEHWVEDVYVVKHDDTYYMVAESSDERSCLLTSKDRIHWEDQGDIKIQYADGKRFIEGAYGTPTLLREDGNWYLFYEREDDGIWLARSTDLQLWTNVQDDPVLHKGPDPYDRYAVSMKVVFKYEGRYYAYYSAAGDPNMDGPRTTNIAVSDDLIHWKKYADNPIIRVNRSSGILVQDGSRHRLYTMSPDVNVWFPRSSTDYPTVEVPGNIPVDRNSSRVRTGTDANGVPAERRVAWADSQIRLKGDVHAHSVVSHDGTMSIGRLAAIAQKSGCEFMALTDHGGPSDQTKSQAAIGGTASYAEYRTAREALPDLHQFYGAEWNFSPEHSALVILEPSEDEREILGSFLDRFDALRVYAPDPLAACAWLHERTEGSAVIIITEPSTISRFDYREPIDVIGPLVEGCPLIVAIEGAQSQVIPTRFGLKDPQPSTGRFEPMVDRIGGGWDELLHAGHTVHVSVGSNFHEWSQQRDFWPCRFSENIFRVPEASPQGILQALRAGTGFVVHGGVVSNLEVVVRGAGIDPPARIGETVTVESGSDVEVSILLETPELDFRHRQNRIAMVELISNVSGQPELEGSWPTNLGGGDPLSNRLTHRFEAVTDRNDGRGFYVRVRGRSARGYWFYTNAVRILPR